MPNPEYHIWPSKLSFLQKQWLNGINSTLYAVIAFQFPEIICKVNKDFQFQIFFREIER